MDYIPPQNLAAERTVLASMLDSFQSTAIHYGCETLDQQCFYSTAHQILFRHIKEMHDREEMVDVLTLSEHLRKTGELEKVGAEPYIAEIINDLASQEHIDSHVLILQDLRDRRRIITQAHELIKSAHNPEIEIKDAVSQNSMDFIFQELKNRIVTVADFDKEIESDYETKQLYPLYDSGWSNLPIKIALGRLNIWTGIPNVGKSTLFDSFMVNMSKLHNWRWLVYSPESFPVKGHIISLCEKAIGKQFGPGPFQMNKNELYQAMDFIRTRFDFINISDVRFSSNEILAFTRHYLKKWNIQGTVIDPFINLKLDIQKGENRTYAIADFLESYRSIARKYNISANIIAHPAKMMKNLPTAKTNPNWYDPVTPYQIDGSGSWYNTSDVCFSVWRGYRENKPILYIFKRRFRYDGDLGEAYFNWNPFTGCFTEAEQSQNDNYPIKQEKMKF
jgi:replicative DNA helicase